jgi:integrase
VRGDRNRWEKHLAPFLKHRRIDQVDVGMLHRFVAELRHPKGEGANPLSNSSVGNILNLLSSFYRWAWRTHGYKKNPVREFTTGMTRKEKKSIHSNWNPVDTPFIKDKETVAKLFAALPAPVDLAYGLCALAGLRPGEALALEWSDVDLDEKVIKVRRQVRHGVVSVPKSQRGRDVPIVPSLLRVLKERAKRSGVVVDPLLVRTTREENKYLDLRIVYGALRQAFAELGLEPMTFYEAGRHSFASLWVLSGLDVYRLSKILGHSSVLVTERYAHLVKRVPDEVLAKADVKLD